MRALIVDDVPAMRHFLTMCLADQPSLVADHAGDGVQATKMLSQNQYDLVLLDINLPLMDGLKVLANFRQSEGDGRQTPVIVVSTTADKGTIERVHRLRARHLAKPTTAGELRRLVAEILGQPEEARSPGAERRREQRLRFPIKVQYQGEPAPLELYAHDINALGAFLVCEAPPAVGTLAVVSFAVPHLQDRVEIESVVVHVRKKVQEEDRPVGFAVQFIPRNSKQSEALARAFVSPPRAAP